MTDFTRVFYFVFGVLSIVGGVLGFIKKDSMASLVAGTVSAVGLFVATWLLGQGNVAMGYLLALVVSLALAGRFVPVYVKTKAMFPAGIMAWLSFASLVVTTVAWMKR